MPISPSLENAFMVAWLFFTGVSTILKLFGFGVIEAGLVRRKNAKSVMIKTLFGLPASGLAFWLFGYSFAYGCYETNCNGFIGSRFFALDGLRTADFATHSFKRSAVGYASYFERCAIANICFGIVSGALTERTKPQCYVILAFVMSGFIFPVVVHWIWGGGWLGECGVLDFAGGGIVHLLGGTIALVGASMIGARRGRFVGNYFKVQTIPFEVQSPAFNTLGVMILWTGWFGFNATHINIVQQTYSVQRIQINTLLSPAMAALTTIVVELGLSRGKNLSAEHVMSSVRIGLTGVTSSCAFIEPHFAILIGFISSFIYLGGSKLIRQFKIDDPVDSCAHFFGGIWSMIAVGLFSKEEFIAQSVFNYNHKGFYGIVYGGDGTLLGWQIVAIITIITWGLVLSGPTFQFCKLINLARVDEETEVYGLLAEGEKQIVKGVDENQNVDNVGYQQKFEQQREAMLKQQEEYRKVQEKKNRENEQNTYSSSANGAQLVFVAN